MFWSFNLSSNAALVQHLVESRFLTNQRAIKAMNATNRSFYCPLSPYMDSPQSIGYGVTISAPHMHATALQELEPVLQPGCSALDIGSGSGYLVAAMARMVAPNGTVKGIEHIPQLVETSKKNLLKDINHDEVLMEMYKEKRLQINVGDGRMGTSEDEKFDAIHVGASASELPQKLVDQLKSPGKILIPIGTYSQNIYLIEKNEQGKISKRTLFPVRYVPLTDSPDDSSDY